MRDPQATLLHCGHTKEFHKCPAHHKVHLMDTALCAHYEHK